MSSILPTLTSDYSQNVCSCATNILTAIGAACAFATAAGLLAEFLLDSKRRSLGQIMLKGTCVVVTGAGTGIGKALAELAHKQGAHVILCGRRRGPLDAVALSLGKECTTVVADCDVTNEECCQRLVDASKATGKNISVVILNAGRSCCGEFDESSETMHNAREMIELNYMANVRLTQLFLPMLQKAKGSFLVISSLSGLFPTFRGHAYTAAKHALNGFFDTLRIEQLSHGVSVTIACPGYVLTDVHTSQLTNTGAPPPARNRKTFMTAEFVADKFMHATAIRQPKIILPAAANIPYLLRSVCPRLVEWVITRGVIASYPDDGTKTLRELAAK